MFGLSVQQPTEIKKPRLTSFSFLELLNCGTHCHPPLSLNPTICHLLSLTSTNLILSPFLLKFPPCSQFFLCRGFVIGPMAFPRHYLLKTKQNHCKQIMSGILPHISHLAHYLGSPIKVRTFCTFLLEIL